MPRHHEGFFSARDGVRLFWTLDAPGAPRAHVGVVHGYGDHCGRYRPFIDALVRDGYAVHAFDYRGHGRSAGRRAYAARWTRFVDDVERFWERVCAAAGDQKAFLVGHSHGALLAVHLAGRGGLSRAGGLVLSAPYFRLALSPPWLKVLAARAVGRLVPWLPVASGLTPADLSRDPAAQAATERDPLYVRHATPRWYVESTRAQGQVLALAPALTLPVLVLHGSEDRVASGEAARAFHEALGGADKRYRVYPGMRHEPLNELGKEEVFRDISGWIGEHL